MKMITAIINKNDTDLVCSSLRDAGYTFTIIATVGGFLTRVHNTLLIGTEDDKVEYALELIRKTCSRRSEVVPVAPYNGMGGAPLHSYMSEVMVGGAIVFVNDVTYFEKM